MTSNCALLLLRLPLKQLTLKIDPILHQVCAKFDKKLYIKIDSSPQSSEKISKIDLIKIIPHIYETASSINPRLDVRVLNPIDSNSKHRLIELPSCIITETNNDNSNLNLDIYLKSIFYNSLENIPVSCLENGSEANPCLCNDKLLNTIDKETYEFVALGGTFDGIHVGHKILFNEATIRCKDTLIVGVTDESMIKSKILWELIEPVKDRIQEIETFLKEIDPCIKADVVSINNIFGPTIEKENLEYLVVSEETQKGGLKINEARLAKNWKPMQIGVVNLLKSVDNFAKTMMQRLNETKVSSSVTRLQKLGVIIRDPLPNHSIPIKPYIIGLTGGVASGKTTIGKYLESLNFGYINYDILGHKTYADVDSKVYKQIVDYFGTDVINPENKLIDRAKLGKIVFSDKKKKEVLESLVWPAIYEMVDQEIERLKINHEVIVLESALLLESNQDSRVHQIWTVFVPPSEAVRRQVETRNLTETEAQKRVDSQMDNLSRIRKSNAIFCSLWEPEFTRFQVDKCVEELRSRFLA